MKKKKMDKEIGSFSSLVCKEFAAKASRKRSIILLSMALIVITAAVYWQVENHEFLNYDDNDYVYNNIHVTTGITGANIAWAFTSMDASNWHPITWLSHMADVQLYGINPRGHHLTNVAIHILSTLLLFLLLFRLTSSPWQSSFVAALFALHPLHVESVAWVAERKDVLSAFFWLLTIYLYAEYVANRKPALYLLALFSFVMGLMAKPMLVTLPVVLLLMDFWPLSRVRDEQGPWRCQLLGSLSQLVPLLKEKIPFFAGSFFSAAITIYAQHKGGAIKTLEEITFGLRFENAIIAYVKYLHKTLWPNNLAVLYPFSSLIPLSQVICSLLVLFLISAAIVCYRRRHPYLAVGWFWFLITLVPVIGLVQVGSQSMADRYTYIPLIGLFIMAAWGVPALAKGLRHRRRILMLLAGAVISASVALTWQQLGYWRDNVSLYRHSLQVTSGNYIAHYNLGIILEEKGDLDAAIKEYRDTLAINPNIFEAHNNLGLSFAKKGDLDAAIKEYREALAIKPNYFVARSNLGVSLATKGDLDSAIKEFREALTINPNFVTAQRNLKYTLDQKQRFDNTWK